MRLPICNCPWGLCLLAALLAGCGSAPPPEARNSVPEKPVAEAAISVVLSGDAAGFIVPCGCTTKQFGGLPRRGTYLTQAARKNPSLLYLDAGGSVHRATDYDGLKLEYLWRGMAAMRPAAMNLGAGEVLLGLERLRQLAATLQQNGGIPLVSANVTAQGALPWKSSVETSIGGLRVAITGVCIPSKAGPGMEVRDAGDAMRTLIPELARNHDAVILLCYGDEPVCLRLISEFPELTAVLAAGVSQPITPRLVDGRTILAATANKGKFLARAGFIGSRNQWRMEQGEIVELSESFADDPAQVQVLNSYKERLKREKLYPARTGEAPALLGGLPQEYRYAGSKACAECHVADGQLHAASHHAHGLETLAAKSFEYDPYCLKCHTTGYGGPDGFVNAESTPQRGGIGCESCHGPSAAHAKDPKIKSSVAAKGACAGCHDPENSPAFDFAVYWLRIQHGQQKVVGRRNAKGMQIEN